MSAFPLLTGPADLHDELSGFGELQDLVVFVAVAADPDEPFRIDVDAVLRVGPLISLARSAPGLDEVSGLVKFQGGGAARPFSSLPSVPGRCRTHT